MKSKLSSAVLSSAVDQIFRVETLEMRRMFSAGTLDPTFGAGGHVTDLTLPAAAAVAVQTDGKVVEVGQILGNFELARFNTNGTPDASFGFMGRLITDLGGVDKPTSLIIQSDGKILAAGLSGSKFAVARYMTDGQLDSTFGTGGVVTADFGAALPAGSANLLLRADGKLVMVGTGGPTGFSPSPTGATKFLFARFNTNGSFDSSFGTGGETTSAAPDGAVINSAALAADQKIVAVGAFYPSFADALIRRFNADGSPDGTAFHGDSAGLQFLHKVAIQADGRILISGESDFPVFFRDNADGTLDSTFSPPPLIADGILPQADGKIIVAGSGFGTPATIDRLSATGALDATWGTAGATPVDNVKFLASAPGGKTIAAGGVTFGGQELDLVRLTSDSGAPAAGTPFAGVPANIPGRIEAENFDQDGEGVAYHDTDAGNNGGIYRFTDVDVEATTGGGFNVGYTHAGEYLKYTVNVVASGSYDFSARAADAGAGAAFHLEVDGVNVTGTLAIPDTGGYQSYQTTTKTGIPLTAGAHTLTLVMESNNSHGYAGNFNWIQFDPSGAPPAATGSISGTVFNDTTNENGLQDSGESAISGRQVYLDIPGIGHFVAGDPTTNSDANGHYSFSGLALVNYLVRVAPVDGTLVDSPVYGGDYFVQLGLTPTVTARDFGIVTPGLSASQSGGFLVASESFLPGSPVADIGIRRYFGNGTVDTTFGIAGYAHLIFNQEAGITNLAVLPNGNILAVLGVAGPSGLYLLSPSGTVLKNIGLPSSQVVARVAIQPDNKIVLSTQTFIGSDRSILRYNSDLMLDNTFGGTGIVPIPAANGYTPTDLAVLGNGNIQATYNNGSNLVVNLTPVGVIL